jgi:hypothetical protein
MVFVWSFGFPCWLIATGEELLSLCRPGFFLSVDFGLLGFRGGVGL